MSRIVKTLGLVLVSCSLVLLFGCQRCANEKPANYQEPVPAQAKAEAQPAQANAKTLTLPDAEDTVLYGFNKEQRYAAIRLIQKDGADFRITVQALFLGSGSLSDDGKLLADISTKALREKEPGLSPADAKHKAIVLANEAAKAELMRLGFADPLNTGKKQVDNVALNASFKGPWATTFTSKLSLPSGETGSLYGAVATRPIAPARQTPKGPRQESSLGLFASIEMPAPEGMQGTMSSLLRPLSKTEQFRPGIVGYRLREAYIDEEGKAALAILDAKLENGDILTLVGGNTFKVPERSQAIKNLQFAPQNSRQLLLQKIKPSAAKPQPAK